MASGIDIQLVDGTGQPLRRGRTDLLVSLRRGGESTFHRAFVTGPDVRVPVEFTDGPRDACTVLVSLKDHREAGFTPVHLQPDRAVPVNLMVIPREAEFDFAAWDVVQQDHPALLRLVRGCYGHDAPARYEALQGDDDGRVRDRKRLALACLLNVVEALAAIDATRPDGTQGTLADYVEQVEPERDGWLRQDRCFVWCNDGLDKVLAANTAVFDVAPKGLHPGAIASYKQKGFGEANVQITLHPDRGNGKVKVELDIDYYHDAGAHLLLEVFPNHLKQLLLGKERRQSLTDPAIVYALRWIAGRQASNGAGRRFRPAFTIRPLPA
ncbi:MAG: hypothetical protein AB7H96_23190 [Vicinamibacterales bacterium]